MKLPIQLLALISLVFLLNLAQAQLTELLFDEAYYWYYAKEMAWGYFDHPPMVAALIKLGSYFFDGELGVRFMSSILSAATLLLLWLMVDRDKKRQYIPHFVLLAFSMTLLNAYGFLMLPDTPLLFFSALFLWAYRRYLQQPGWLLAVFLGLIMAALMYSKYHAALVIIFVLLSNWRLVFDSRAWLAVAVALLAYLPHLNWLYQNDFVSLKYHLFERPNRAYDFNDFTLGYLINLVALFGLTFPWMYQALFKTKSKDLFTKALLFLTYGVLIFFFISSFQRRVQTQWIIVVCIPMFILAFNCMLNNANIRKWLYRASVANMLILLWLRVGLIYEPLFPIVFETHGNREWVGEIKSQIGNTPVVFENSYREAPMYSFYSGIPSFSLNNIFYRQNQYSIDSSEARMRHKKVLYIAKTYKRGDIGYTTAKGDSLYGRYIPDFESYRKLSCSVSPREDGTYNLSVYNPYKQAIPLDKLRFGTAFLNNYKQPQRVVEVQPSPIDTATRILRARDSTYFRFSLPPHPGVDASYFKVTISENGLYWGLNGTNIKL